MPSLSVGINSLSQYQSYTVLTADINISAPFNNGYTNNGSVKSEKNSDKLKLSSEAGKLSREYTNRKNTIKNKYDNDKQRLNAEYKRKKKELDAEYQQKKRALGISIYA